MLVLRFYENVWKCNRVLYNINLLFTAFPSSRMEMEAVADIFDRNKDGFIDYREFVAALRPDTHVSYIH